MKKGNLFKAMALTGALLLSSQAHAKFVSLDIVGTFGVNAAGTGAADAVPMNTLDYLGFSFTDTPPIEGESFVDFGYIYATGGDYGGASANLDDDGGTQYQLSTVFSDWIGEYTYVSDDINPVTGIPADFEAEFFSGTVSWDSQIIDGAGEVVSVVEEDILELSIITGIGGLTTSGISNRQTGDIELIFEVTDVTEGYFFLDLNDDGEFTEFEDLAYLMSMLDPEDEGYYLGYTFGTNTIQPSESREALEERLEAIFGLDEGTLALGFVATNDGQFFMATIPEPGMLSLMGLAFLGLAGFQRRRKTA